MRVSVIGGGDTSTEHRETARTVGQLLGDRNHTLVCGGLSGLMEAACRGAAERDGETIGILPGEDPRAANPYVDTAIATGIGHARNALVVLNGDAIVAIDGSGGTLSEIGFGSVYDRPIAGIRSHDVPGVTAVDSPAAAVEYVESAIRE
jgi:uncharacterized protein (TIGR00725 family)